MSLAAAGTCRRSSTPVTPSSATSSSSVSATACPGHYGIRLRWQGFSTDLNVGLAVVQRAFGVSQRRSKGFVLLFSQYSAANNKSAQACRLC